MLKPPRQSVPGYNTYLIQAPPSVGQCDASPPEQMVRGWQPAWGDTIFIAALVVVCGLSAFIGIPAPLGSFAHDTFFFLDNAYRVSQGQVPHRDFSSAWGPVIFLIHAAGLILSGMRPTGIGYANALFGAIVGIWTFLLIRARWSSASACALGVYAILLITAPFPLGINPLDFGYAMTYNRYGYALFGILMMECAANAPSVNRSTRRDSIGAISTGAAFALLAFLKVSYAIVAVPFIVVSTIAASAGRVRRFVEVFGGFAMVSVLVLCYLRFSIFDMWRDLAMAATARQLSLRLWLPAGVLDLAQTILIVLFAGFGYGVKTGGAHDRATPIRRDLFALLTVAAGYLLLFSNQQKNTFPLNGYAAVALAARHGSLSSGKPLKWPGFSQGFPRALLLGICFLPLCLENGISLAGAAVGRLLPTGPDVISLASTERGSYLHFRPMTGTRGDETTGMEYVEAVNDGLELIRRHSANRDGVLAFDEFNPFNYLLDLRSPRGGIAAVAYDYVFCDAAHPTAERFFGDTSYVMVRKYKKDGPNPIELANVSALMRIYGPSLMSNFSVVEETEHWVLWHRD